MSSKIGTLLFEITNSCNLNCRHCYKRDFDSDDLSLSQIKIILKKVAQYGIKDLILTRGEPLLRRDLFKIIDSAKMSGFESIVINTNGILLDNSKIINQIKKRLDHIKAIMVSLDGATSNTHDYIRGKNQFKKLVQILKKISKQFPLGINVTIGKWNLQEFNDFFTIYDKYNAFYINFGLFIPLENGLEVKNQLLSSKECLSLIQMAKQKRDSGYNLDLCSFPYANLIAEDISGHCCNVFTDFISVSAEGNVMPCILYDFNCGSLLKLDLEDILKHPLVQKFHIPSKLKEKIKGRCKDCVEFDICKAGCNVLTYALNHDIFKSDPLCPINYLVKEDF